MSDIAAAEIEVIENKHVCRTVRELSDILYALDDLRLPLEVPVSVDLFWDNGAQSVRVREVRDATQPEGNEANFPATQG